ncbi:MAG: PIG-L deacetylase family protein [Terriglobales bacterium]
MLIAAHPDDEAIGAMGYTLATGAAARIVFLTDGAPAARFRPPQFTVRRQYRRLRKAEARLAWRGFAHVRLGFAPFPDQALALHLDAAAAWLERQIAPAMPELVLAPAFEGGHPDHDAANVLAAVIARPLGIPVWEYALYTARDGAILRQCFPDAPQWTRQLSPALALAKQRALGAYVSQRGTLAAFDCAREALRPLPAYDYSRPPGRGPTVYEMWGWPWRAAGLARRFAAFLASRQMQCAC